MNELTNKINHYSKNADEKIQEEVIEFLRKLAHKPNSLEMTEVSYQAYSILDKLGRL